MKFKNGVLVEYTEGDCLRRDWLDFNDGVMEEWQIVEALEYHFPKYKVVRKWAFWMFVLLYTIMSVCLLSAIMLR